MAKVSKPALYYYFNDKAGLFGAVVDSAHDERYELMRAAAERGSSVRQKLEEILADIFEYSLRNQELMRLTFATAFATSNEAPAQGQCRQKGRRTFDFIRALIEQGQASGELSKEFSSEELAMGIYGQLNSYVMLGLLVPECRLDREAAVKIVRLFMQGAVAGGAAPGAHAAAKNDNDKNGHGARKNGAKPSPSHVHVSPIRNKPNRNKPISL